MAEVVERTWSIGPLSVVGPTRAVTNDGRVQWCVLAIDSMTEESAEKLFNSAKKAQGFIDELVGGHPPIDPLAGPERPESSGQSAGARPIVTTPTPPTLSWRHARPDPLTGKRANGQGPFNLKAVADALIDEELDPFVEVARALKERVPVRTRDGEAVKGADGEPLTVPRIAGIERAKILIELGQYISPKLKAVEVKIEDKHALTAEQLDARIAAIYGRKATADARTIEATPGAGQ